MNSRKGEQESGGNGGMHRSVLLLALCMACDRGGDGLGEIAKQTGRGPASLDLRSR